MFQATQFVTLSTAVTRNSPTSRPHRSPKQLRAPEGFSAVRWCPQQIRLLQAGRDKPKRKDAVLQTRGASYSMGKRKCCIRQCLQVGKCPAEQERRDRPRGVGTEGHARRSGNEGKRRTEREGRDTPGGAGTEGHTRRGRDGGTRPAQREGRDTPSGADRGKTRAQHQAFLLSRTVSLRLRARYGSHKMFIFIIR